MSAIRITSTLYCAQLVRRVFGSGGFAAVLRPGAEEAGAIFVVARDRLGGLRLFVPAAQSEVVSAGERRFSEVAIADEPALERRLASETRFDPDCWIVEIETEDPHAFVETVSGSQA